MALGRSVSGKDNAMRGGPQSSHFLQAGFINATINLGSREALGNTKKPPSIRQPLMRIHKVWLSPVRQATGEL